MNESLIIQFSPESISSTIGTGRGSRWAHIEQKYKTELEKEANIHDVRNMLDLAKNGISPYQYISDECPYMTIDGDTVIISLDFYVWPSMLNLKYDLSTEFGVISQGLIVSDPTEFDVIFNGSNNEELDWIFEGIFTQQMPIITPEGDKIPLMIQVPEGVTLNVPYMTVADSLLSTNLEIYTVFRAKGIRKGFQHTIVMHLTKEDGYTIDNLRNSITLKYVDDYGEEQIEILNLEIPKCVEDLLGVCSNDPTQLKFMLVIDSNNSNKLYKVYVNSCDGSIIKKRWENK